MLISRKLFSRDIVSEMQPLGGDLIGGTRSVGRGRGQTLGGVQITSWRVDKGRVGGYSEGGGSD